MSDPMKRVKKVFINAKRDYKEISLIKANFETVESPDEKADICISIGGDGTFIKFGVKPTRFGGGI